MAFGIFPRYPGKFAEKEQLLLVASYGRVISSLEDVKEVLDEGWAAGAELNPHHEEIDVQIYLPDVQKSEFQTYSMTPNCLPVPITACHAWSFRRMHPNRKTAFGRLENFLKMTNVEGRARILPGEKNAAMGNVFTPEVESRLEFAGAAEEDDGPDDVGAEAVLFDTEVYKGWKISYRKEQVEQCLPEKIRPKVVRKYAQMKEVLETKEERARLKGFEYIAAKAMATRNKKNEKERAMRRNVLAESAE